MDMTDEQLDVLAVELAKPEYAALSLQAAANLLNSPTVGMTQVSIAKLKNLTAIMPIALNSGGITNLWLIIKRKGEEGIDPFEMLWDLFVDPDFTTIDFAPNGMQFGMFDAGLNALVAEDTLTFTETHKAALVAQVMGLADKISVAKSLDLPEIRYYEVERARIRGGLI